MVETFFLDWGLSLGAGLLFGLAGRKELHTSSPFGARAFRWGFAYLQTGILAIAITLYVMRPDWMWMYWVDARALPIAVVVLAFSMYELAFVAGFSIAAHAPKRPVVAVAVAVGAALGAAQVLTRARLTHFGTLAEFHAGAARSGAPEATFVLAAGAASLLALVVLLRRLATSPGPQARGTQASP